MALLDNFFSNQFIPHGHCYLWKSELVWLHVVSDLLIALAYYSIPVMLLYFVNKRKDLPFDWIFLMFSAFIITCGTTHVMEIWTLWYPTYWLSGFIKAITALISVTTAIELLPLIPQALALPSPAQLAAEIAERQRTEEVLRESEQRLSELLTQLEFKVEERTVQLIKINESLQVEIAKRQQIETALRESEERFRTAFHQAAVGIAHVSLDGRWLLVNQKLCNMVGYTSEELESSTFQEITHPDDLDADLKYVNEMLVGNIQTYTMEKRYFRKDGSIVWINLTVSLTRQASGEPKYFISVVEDISDRKQSQAQIQSSLLEKEVLLKEIYHRVKNNLQVISSLLNLQSEYIKDTEDLEIFQQSQQRIASMALIHEKMCQSPDLARINFGEYIRDLVASLFSCYEVYNGAISLNLNIDNEVLLSLDLAIPCGLIIHELVSNSLKYGFPQGGEGEIYIEISQDIDQKFTITVSDNGIGLPPNFDFNNTASLGWQLVEALTQQIAGKINIKSHAGVEFQITFPLI